MNKSIVRRILFIIASGLDWCFSVGYSQMIYRLMLDGGFIKPAKNIFIDGSDFTPIANLMVTGMNGFLYLLNVCLSVLYATIFSCAFAAILRATTIRKTDIVEQSEIKFTKYFIFISSILAFAVGVLLSNIRLTVVVLILSWQQPIFMFLIYFIPLYKRAYDKK